MTPALRWAAATLAVASMLAAAPSCVPAPRPAEPGAPAAAVPSALPTKPFSLAILEDYDRGADLAAVGRDFRLMRELGITTWRGSIGWDDFEPESGALDLAWLRDFADLAARHGIALRPYLGYTAEWAAAGRTADGQTWNDPPADLDAWGRFAGAVARDLAARENVLSYEIYNEENAPLWWDGTVAEYAAVLARGAAAVRAADPDARVLLGGMVWPDVDWLEALCETHGVADAFDVVPFHAYPETWGPDSVPVERYLDETYRGAFLETVDGACGGKPVWINEAGYATSPGRTELDQARWWARALAAFAADPRVEHVGVYEIRDLDPGSDVIGEPENYHLGLVRADGRRKLAFHTVRTLARLLASDSLRVADAALGVEVEQGRAGRLERHAFIRPDGRQVVVVWDAAGGPTLALRLPRRGATAIEWGLDGTPSPVRGFDGRTLRGVRLSPGAVRIFEVAP